MGVDNRQFKDAIYTQFARIGKALSSPRRLELLDLLIQGPKPVEALAKASNMTVANTSRHLQVLLSARLVENRKQGVRVRYRLADEAVGKFFLALRELSERRLTEIEAMTRDFLRDKGQLEPVDQEQLLQRARDGSVTVLDVRPEDEFQSGHLPGAISVPLTHLRETLQELPKDQEIVAYCRGPYCVLAVDAVQTLRSAGFQAVRLKEGVADWTSRGLPVEVED